MAHKFYLKNIFFFAIMNSYQGRKQKENSTTPGKWVHVHL